jgi:ParB family chromosome partitioning protein
MTNKIIDHGDIPIDLIAPNPEQPRQQLDQAGLEELAQSIRERGVIQPIVVELAPEPTAECRYILHTGERRWRAAKLAGLETIPAIVVDESTPGDRLVRALVENVQRQDMSPLDVARAFARMHDELGLTDQQIADQVGKSRSTVANARRLLDLPEEVQDLANCDGVSERQIAALLPLYQQPKILKKAEKARWGDTPSELIGKIHNGQVASSNEIRNRVTQMIRANTEDLSRGIFPLDHAFDGVKVRSPRCDDCPARVKSGDEWRCPDETCFDRKTEHWRAEQIRLASEASGIPAGDLASGRHGQVAYFYGEGDLLQQIVADRCPNLRLEWDVYGGSSLPDFPNVKIVCYHGEGKHCTCLSKARAERTRNDPAHVAEREREKEMNRLLDKYGALVAAALRSGNLHVWLRILRIVDYQIKKGDAMTLDQIQQRIGRNLVNNNLTWVAKNDLQIAQRQIDDLLATLGIGTPETGDPSDPAADLKRRFERIHGWIATLGIGTPETGDPSDPAADFKRRFERIHGWIAPAQVTVEAVDGNLANLDKLTVEFDQIAEQHIDNPDFDGFLLSIAEAWELLTSLKHELQTNGHVGVQTPTQDALRTTEEASHG